MVERHLAKVEVAGSSPVIRSTNGHEISCPSFLQKNMAPWPSGKAKVCNTSIPGPIPGGASRKKHICNADVLFFSYLRLRRVKSTSWMKSLRDEIPLRGEGDAADLISSEAARRRFHPNGVRISSRLARFHFPKPLALLHKVCYNKTRKAVEI